MIQAIANGSAVQTERFRPCADRHRFPHVGEKNIVPAVPALCFAVSPTAIFLGVWAVIVDAIQGHALWFWTHISEKRKERFSPRFANTDTSSAVVPVGVRVFIPAALLNALPNVVRASAAKLGSRFRRTNHQTTAGLTVSAFQVVEYKNSRSAAIASASDLRVPVALKGLAGDSELPEFGADVVGKESSGWHLVII